MIRHLSFSILTALLFFSLTTNATADNTFSWQDTNGNTFFGSKPPANAKNVVELHTNRVSKYSSDKVLKAYEGYRAGATVAEKPDGSKTIKEENLDLTSKQDNSPNSTATLDTENQGKEPGPSVGDPKEWEVMPLTK